MGKLYAYFLALAMREFHDLSQGLNLGVLP
jgi:hypothetical protein